MTSCYTCLIVVFAYNIADIWKNSINFQHLIENLDRDLQYAIKVEGKMELDSVSNYEDVKKAIKEKVYWLINIHFYTVWLFLLSPSLLSIFFLWLSLWKLSCNFYFS